MRHQIIAGNHHQQNPDTARKDPALSAHQAKPGNTSSGSSNMAGRKGETVFRGRPDSLPPLAVKIGGFKRPRTGDGVFQQDVRNQRSAADSTENAETGTSPAREQHQHNAEQQKENAFFSEQGNQFAERSKKGTGGFRQLMHKAENRLVVACKSGVQPESVSSKGHQNTFFPKLETLYRFSCHSASQKSLFQN